MNGSGSIHFQVHARDPASSARRGLLKLSHGSVETPAFLPVGTQGTVKGVLPRDLEGTGVAMILANMP